MALSKTTLTFEIVIQQRRLEGVLNELEHRKIFVGPHLCCNCFFMDLNFLQLQKLLIFHEISLNLFCLGGLEYYNRNRWSPPGNSYFCGENPQASGKCWGQDSCQSNNYTATIDIIGNLVLSGQAKATTSWGVVGNLIDFLLSMLLNWMARLEWKARVKCRATDNYLLKRKNSFCPEQTVQGMVHKYDKSKTTEGRIK
ncbi:unnamed protein product [Allacma fusca]|uniref:Uncharacterized protein n=1 Tax=Allacma fusca TaxID=39272 RepID=A0A8J2KL53_9HEXA|nr:unnamed protein product [Allacma fusca]